MEWRQLAAGRGRLLSGGGSGSGDGRKGGRYLIVVHQLRVSSLQCLPGVKPLLCNENN